MRYYPFTAVTLGVVTAFAAQLSFAEGDSNQDHSQAKNEKSSQSADCLPGSKQMTQMKDMKDLKQIRASQLIGVNVTSKDGENLGQVQDLIVDPQTGFIKLALVGKGFMAGLGEKAVPVPWQAVNVQSERQFALNIDKAKMQSAPAWTQADQDQPDYIVRIYRFYELEPRSDIGSPGEQQQSGSGQGSSSDLDDHDTQPASPSTDHDQSPDQQH